MFKHTFILKYNFNKFMYRFCFLILFKSMRIVSNELIETTTTVLGSGATSTQEVYKMWATSYESYRAAFSDVKMTYEARGSGIGKQNIISGKTSFAVSDAPLTEEEKQNYSGLRYFPTFAWGLVLGYNIPGVNNLTITREQIVGIYNGTITNWNDSTFNNFNPFVQFPNATIVPVARFDQSGSTSVFTTALSSISSQWKRTFGTFQIRAKWNTNIKVFAQRTTGLADALTNTPFSCGYLSAPEADENGLSYAWIVNKAGRKVKFSVETISAAVNGLKEILSHQLNASITDTDSQNAYPLTSFSYFIVNNSVQSRNCLAFVELNRFINWFLTSKISRRNAQAMGCQLTEDIFAPVINDILKTSTCNSLSLETLVKEQIFLEEETLKTWKIPLFISIPFIILILTCFIVYAAYNKYLYYKMLNLKPWKINFYHIELTAKKTVPSDFSHEIPDNHELKENEKNNWILTCFQTEQTGKYDGRLVILKNSQIEKDINYKWSGRDSRYFLDLKNMNHSNIAIFLGLTSSPLGQVFFAEEYCVKGSLIKVLLNKKYQLSHSVCFAAARDICSAMCYLHGNQIVVGLLQLSSCVVDSRWAVKLCGWEQFSIYETFIKSNKNMLGDFTAKVDHVKSVYASIKARLELENTDINNGLAANFNFWLAPEIIESNYFCKPSKATDMYSFGLMLFLIFYKHSTSQNILHQINIERQTDLLISDKLKIIDKNLSYENVPTKICNIINLACSSDPFQRPNFERVLAALLSCDTNPSYNVLDHVMNMYENSVLEMENDAEKHEVFI